MGTPYQLDYHDCILLVEDVFDVIIEWSQKIKAPTITEFPYGHVDRRCMLPIGKNIILNVSRKNGVEVIC